jgi:hypothetical protein
MKRRVSELAKRRPTAATDIHIEGNADLLPTKLSALTELGYQTAKALDLSIRPTLLARVDEVIE